MSRTFVPLSMVLAVACAGGGTDTDTDAGAAAESVESRLERLLTGTFDSSEQAAADEQYFDVRMIICEVSAPSLGDRVLYLEQAQVTALDQPYRQRLYVIEQGETDQIGVSRIFTIPNAGAAVGACEDASKLPDGQGALEREGCAVSMAWDGTAFSGGTTGTDCPTSLGGDYASSEITLDEERLTSWDRGFFDDGTQAWGAVGGGYIFERRTPVPQP